MIWNQIQDQQSWILEGTFFPLTHKYTFFSPSLIGAMPNFMFWLFSVLTNFKETEGGTSLFALNIGLNCYFSPHSCRAHSGFCYRLWYYIWNSTYYYYYYIYYYYILLLLYLLFINYIIIYLLLLYYSY